MRKLVAIDKNPSSLSLPWKARLLDAQTTASVASAVEQVIASGVSATEVRTFIAEHKDVFGDDAVHLARRAGEALLDQTSPKLRAKPSAGGVKAHEVRFAALPWFQRASLTQPPLHLTANANANANIVVDGETFSPRDILTLLRSA